MDGPVVVPLLILGIRKSLLIHQYYSHITYLPFLFSIKQCQSIQYNIKPNPRNKKSKARVIQPRAIGCPEGQEKHWGGHDEGQVQGQGHGMISESSKYNRSVIICTTFIVRVAEVSRFKGPGSFKYWRKYWVYKYSQAVSDTTRKPCHLIIRQ